MTFAQAPFMQLLLQLMWLAARLNMGFDQAAAAVVIIIKVHAAVIREVLRSIEIIQQAAASGSRPLVCQPEPWPRHPSQL